MRILVGGISHESNTLNPIITGRDDFAVFTGEEILDRGMLPHYSSTGIIETLEEAGCTVIPTVIARAVPNGVVSKKLFYELKAEMLRMAKQAAAEGTVDGICLGLHGSMKVEDTGCAEEIILAELRELFPAIPLTVALDMHATITEKMVANADGFVGYKTAPHIDCRETGVHAARMLLGRLREGKKLYTSYRKIPMLIAGEKSESAVEPMAGLISRCIEAEKAPEIAAASYLLGFPWADSSQNGVTALVTSIDDPKAAEKKAAELADAFWSERENFNFRGEYYDSETSVKLACEAVLNDGTSPVFISDSGDNPTAGSTGDSTELLEKLIAQKELLSSLPTPVLYSGFYAEEACWKCIKSGPGTEIDLSVGAVWDKKSGSPVRMKAKVIKTLSGYGPYSSDLSLIGWENIQLVLTSKHIGFGDEDLLPALSVDPESYCIVVVKLGYLEACFRNIAAKAVMATSKGCSNELLETIDFRKVTRPIYPLDPEMEYLSRG